tara:strand:- start:2333 stop:3025 length:693 start_codon:yes stop_codon:yes gene_type:complete
MNVKSIYKYDIALYPFHKFFLDHFSKLGVKRLDLLHDQVPVEYRNAELLSADNDQNQNIHTYLYKIDPAFNLDVNETSGEFIQCYEKFIQYVRDNFFDEKLIYQSKPTLRVHYPNNLAVGEFHRDGDYNHPLEEINIWVPVTSAKETSSIWIESEYDKQDFSPSNLNLGEFLIFDSALMHGNKKNQENLTRISFDFRVIPYSKWKNNNIDKSSVTRNVKFKIGDYYSVSE